MVFGLLAFAAAIVAQFFAILVIRDMVPAERQGDAGRAHRSGRVGADAGQREFAMTFAICRGW